MGEQLQRTDMTSVHAGRAADGHADSLAWIVERYSPLLYQQANHRLPKVVRRSVGPEDVLNDVWVSVLPGIGTLCAENTNLSSVLLKYFTTTTINRCNELARRFAMGKPLAVLSGTITISGVTLDATGVVTNALRNESAQKLHDAFEDLGDEDREVLILRGIEQRPLDEVARLTNRTENGVSQRFRRACQKVRERLPGTLVDEFVD